jgi:hypothetical protein
VDKMCACQLGILQTSNYGWMPINGCEGEEVHAAKIVPIIATTGLSSWTYCVFHLAGTMMR